MTDNVVKAGIEDVLSSVKRLVSEESRKVPDLASKRKPSRLVLTDSLRVDDPVRVERKQEAPEGVPGCEAERTAKPLVLSASDIIKNGEREPANTSVLEDGPKAEAADDLAGSLSAKIEALEAAIARTEDQWEPDGNSDDAYSGTQVNPLSWDGAGGFGAGSEQLDDQIDETEDENFSATFVRSSQASYSERAEPEADDPDDLDVPTLDEDALRELVADVVRQELQGVLGERITRNLRKLVRREIHRALSAQNLE